MWEEIEIDGFTVDVFEPAARVPHGALIYLHGHGGERLRDQPEFTRLLAESGLPVMAPQCGKCWWLDRPVPGFEHELTPMQFVNQRITAAVNERWEIGCPQIGLLGLSMGGQGVLNLAYRHGRRFPCVAAISPTIDFHSIHGRGLEIDQIFETPEAARQETVTLHLHPLNWPKHQFFACDPQDPFWFEGTQRLASKLSSSGVLYESDLLTSHGGHSWTYFNHMARQAIPFLSRSLEKVSHELPRA